MQNGLGFKSFDSARRTLSGIEVVHMLRKNLMIEPGITMFKSLKNLYLILIDAREPNKSVL